MVSIDTSAITDWPSFHEAFRGALGFPSFYGRNMDAWIDCMTSLDQPGDGLTKVHAPLGGLVVLNIRAAGVFAARCPEQYAALVESAAFVNWRRLELGQEPVLELSFLD